MSNTFTKRCRLRILRSIIYSHKHDKKNSDALRNPYEIVRIMSQLYYKQRMKCHTIAQKIESFKCFHFGFIILLFDQLI